MNARTKLNTLLLATLLLSPAVFGGTEPKQQTSTVASDVARIPVAVESVSQPGQGATAVSRAVLQRLVDEARQQVMSSLRDSAFLDAAIQAAAPASGNNSGQKLSLTAR